MPVVPSDEWRSVNPHVSKLRHLGCARQTLRIEAYSSACASSCAGSCLPE